MSINFEVIENANRLYRVDKMLWDAYVKSKKGCYIPVFNLKKAISISWKLLVNKRIKFYEYYPFYAFLAAFFAVISPIYSNFLIFYVLFLGGAFFFFNDYRKAITAEILENREFVIQGLGIDDLSLTVYGIVKSLDNSEISISKSDIGAIAKIEKSKQEKQEISFGFDDSVRRLFFTTMFASPFYVLIGDSNFWKYFEILKSLMATDRWLLYVISIISMFFLLLYLIDVILLNPNRKKKNKNYLLILNILHESWLDSKPKNEYKSDYNFYQLNCSLEGVPVGPAALNPEKESVKEVEKRPHKTVNGDN